MSLTSYLLVVLIALIILLTITYTTDFSLPVNLPKIFDPVESSTSSSSEIEYEKIKKQTSPPNTKTNPIINFNQPPIQQTYPIIDKTQDTNSFLIDTNFASIDSDIINKHLFTEDFAMTENTGNVIADALRNL